MSFVFLDEKFAQKTRENVKNGQGLWVDVRFELRRKAEECMHRGPWSVVCKQGKNKNPHDYYSDAPYWWPNPEDPNGAYIRRDGQLNPNRFTSHRVQMEQMAETVLYLALAGYYLDEISYINRAVHLIKVWFLDESTKMNPHLEYAQAIHGICEGRGIGIIDTNMLVQVIHASGFIGQYAQFDDEINELKTWFGDYLHWLNTSEKGLEEKNYFNKHSNWWNVQAAAFAAFTENKELLGECFDKFRFDILPNQLNSEGAFEDELTRTRSYHYCLFNLEACALTCEIAYYKGVDLWNFQETENKSIEKAIDFMLPYIENPFLWRYEQIYGEGLSDQLSLQLGAIRLHRVKYERINQQRRADFRYIRNASRLGPLVLLPGY